MTNKEPKPTGWSSVAITSILCGTIVAIVYIIVDAFS